MKSEIKTEWFKDWFDSPYYHILYKNRDNEEATFFIDHLIEYLKPEANAKMLDLACGRGRHAIYLNKKGFTVTGLDLSLESINYASKFAKDDLIFEVHDMRNLLCSNCFDYVFNLFTSFGYFERKYENLKVIRNMAAALKPGGKLVLDFFNVKPLLGREPFHEKREIKGIEFEISKKITEDKVIKNIEVRDGEINLHFEEKVLLLQPSDFEGFFKESNLMITDTFGSYDLAPFDLMHSDRLIYVVQKP